MTRSVYGEPFYYEIAFGFVDPKAQVDLFEEFQRRYGGAKANRFLDIGCGPSLQLRELARRGYEAVGLDLSPDMLSYLGQRATEEGISIETVQSDMSAFRLRRGVDFAFTMMGTINCFKSNDGLLGHLESVAQSLGSGGLYLIENLMLDWPSEDLFKPQSWLMEKDGIKVGATYSIQLQDALGQMIRETIRLEIDDHGNTFVLEESSDVKIVFPQEFLALVEQNGKLEFLGWFERDSPVPLEKASMDNITLLRRK